MDPSHRIAPERGLLRLSKWSSVAAVILIAASFFLFTSVWTTHPTCAPTDSLLACWAAYPGIQASLSTFFGGLLLAAGTIWYEHRSRKDHPPRPRGSRGRSRLEAALALLGIALLLGAAVTAFVPAPLRSYRFSNADLTIVNETNQSVQETVTIQAYSGEFVNGQWSVTWIENRTGLPAVRTGEPPFIQPGSGPFNMSLASLAEDYPVPADGVYRLYLISLACPLLGPICYSEAYHPLTWLNVTAVNPTLVPAIQLGLSIVGSCVYGVSIFVARIGRRGTRAGSSNPRRL